MGTPAGIRSSLTHQPMRSLRCSAAPSIWAAWSPNLSSMNPAVLFDIGTFVIAFALALVIYPRAISTLRRLKAGQVIQEELPDSHQKKAGTPTGGGIVFVALGILGGLLATLAGHAGALPSMAGPEEPRAHRPASPATGNRQNGLRKAR